MTVRRGSWLLCAASRCRTHPPYVNRFGGICPALNLSSLPALRGKSGTITFTPKLGSGEPGGESMPMTPFMERFPELGARETRSVTVPPGQDLPDGEFGFL